METNFEVCELPTLLYIRCYFVGAVSEHHAQKAEVDAKPRAPHSVFQMFRKFFAFHICHIGLQDKFVV